MTRKQEDAAPLSADEAPGTTGGTGAPDGVSEAALKQYREDQKKRLENPNEVVRRDANPDFGGESFAYLGDA